MWGWAHAAPGVGSGPGGRERGWLRACHVGGVPVPYHWVIRPGGPGTGHGAHCAVVCPRRAGSLPGWGPISFEEMGERRPGERVSFPLDPQSLVWGKLWGSGPDGIDWPAALTLQALRARPPARRAGVVCGRLLGEGKRLQPYFSTFRCFVSEESGCCGFHNYWERRTIPFPKGHTHNPCAPSRQARTLPTYQIMGRRPATNPRYSPKGPTH